MATGKNKTTAREQSEHPSVHGVQSEHPSVYVYGEQSEHPSVYGGGIEILLCNSIFPGRQRGEIVTDYTPEQLAAARATTCCRILTAERGR